MQVQSYLFFDGRCEEALEFYRKALDAEVTMLMRYKDSPDTANQPPNSGDKIMHASFIVGETTVLASDGHCSGHTEFKGFGLSLTVATEADAQKLFAALSAGGQVLTPLVKTFFSPAFGMTADKFGVMWMVYVAP